MRSEQEVSNAIELHADTVRRLCAVYLKNEADTEDIFQIVFIKYMQSDIVFYSREHEKAWIIRITINACKDLLRSFFRRFTVSISEVLDLPHEDKYHHSEVLDAVLSLPPKYKEVVYLHYYEGYTAPEISDLLKIKTNTVYTLLTRSKKLLQEKIGGEHS